MEVEGDPQQWPAPGILVGRVQVQELVLIGLDLALDADRQRASQFWRRFFFQSFPHSVPLPARLATSPVVAGVVVSCPGAGPGRSQPSTAAFQAQRQEDRATRLRSVAGRRR